jgi:YggT family protein
MSGLIPLLRYAVLAAAGAAVLGAGAAMAVQARTINPFGRAARAIRAVTDPVLAPIERRLLRAGGNPQNAPWWLAGAAIVGGIVLVTAVEWAAGQALVLAGAASAGPGYAFRLVVDWAFNLVMLALVIRIIGSWIGASRYSRWMRPFVWLTEWLLAPLRRVVPPVGRFDLTPLVAWILLQLARGWVLRAL